MEEDNLDASVRVSFSTAFDKYRVTTTPFSLPLRLTRFGLSEVINHLLNLSPAIPFDFLINNNGGKVHNALFLRSDLNSHISKYGLTLEDVVNIEYMPLMDKPEESSESKEPDWISAVDGHSIKGAYITASYDGNLRFYDSSSSTTNVITTFQTHLKPIKAFSVLHHDSNTFNDGGEIHIVTASKDQTLAVQSIKKEKTKKGVTINHNIHTTCLGHNDSVECVAASLSNPSLFVSGDWNGNTLVWSIPSEASDDTEAKEHSNKKRKINDSTSVSQKQATVLQTFRSSNQCVSSVLFKDEKEVFTGSYDHCIRKWDVETGGLLHTFHGNKVITSLASTSTASLIASGHMDNKVRVWDTRTTGDEVIKLTLSSHTSLVTNVKFAPLSSFMLLSSSHDGDIKIWDIRASIPLYSLKTSKDNKVLSADYNQDGTVIVTGGSDCIFKTFNVNTTK